jgi:hypothetical protein
VEPALAEDLDHLVVVGEHLGRERRDPVALGDAREVREQDGRDAVPLPRVGDEEGDLRAVLGGPHIRAVGDDRRCRATDGDERESVRVVDIDRPMGHPVQIGRAEEAEPDRFRGESLEELPDLGLVVGANGPDVDGRSATQDDVRFLFVGVGGTDAHAAVVGSVSCHRVAHCCGSAGRRHRGCALLRTPSRAYTGSTVRRTGLGWK